MEHFGPEYQDNEDDDAAIQHMIEESLKESNKQEREKEGHDSSHGCTDGSTEIFTAIRQGNERAVRRLSVEKKDRFRETDSQGWTPLHQAAAQVNQTILELTFRATGNAAIESSSLTGQTPLCVAVEHGLLENASFLLQQGANPDSQNHELESDTPLVTAIRSNRKDLFDLLLQHGSRANQRGVHNRCPLHEASQLGSIEMVEALLKAKADPDPRSAYGLTPLALAAQKGHLQVVDTLLRRGADVLSQAQDEASVLFEAAATCDPDVISLLLSYGADANIPKVTGHLPILRAAHRGHLEALQLLIPVTSDEAVDDSGMSPLHSAAAGGHPLCIQALLEAGYDPNDVLHPCVRRNYDDERRSVLYFAVANNDVASARVLLEAGAMPNVDPIKCLQVALNHGNYELINLLLRYGANVNYYCKVNTTHFPSALQHALKDEVILRMLCNYGYDVERCFDCPYGDGSHIPDDFEGWSNTVIKDNMFCEVISVSFLRDYAGPLVRIMLDYVSHHVTFCSMLKPILVESEQWPDICIMQDNVRCLQHLCRLRIRGCLGRLRLRAPVFMSFLPLPPRLKDYILYREYDLYGQQSSVRLDCQ